MELILTGKHTVTITDTDTVTAMVTAKATDIMRTAVRIKNPRISSNDFFPEFYEDHPYKSQRSVRHSAVCF